jgi:hypothetical protein
MYAAKDPTHLNLHELSTSTFTTKANRWLNFSRELIFKELGSCFRHIWYRIRYLFNSEAHHLNPKIISAPIEEGQIAKVTLFLHGVAAHGSCFIPLANTLKNANIGDLYTVRLKQTPEDPVPVQPLNDKILELYHKYLQQGYRDVHFALVGHSLGALVSAKYIWRKWNTRKPPQIAFLVSLGGRLKNYDNSFSWFCEDVKPEVEQTYQAILKAPYKTKIYSIWGDQDALVSKESAHLFGNHNREHTIEGWGHGGIVFAPKTHELIMKKIQNWKVSRI